MAGNTFSTQLQNLRKERKMTQEQLSEVLGVSPQAVSKWENGSYPDAEIIPRIAEFFEVPIDYLYGSAKRVTTAEQMIIAALQKQKNAGDRFDRMLDFCWAMQSGNFAEGDFEEYEERIRRSEKDTVSGSVIINNEGFSLQRFNSDLEYYMLVKSPEKGFAGYLQVNDRLAELFAFLGKKENLKILFYLLSLDDTEALRESTIARKVSVPKEQVKVAVKYLRGLGKQDNSLFTESRIVDEDDEKESVYQNYPNLSYYVIMLLICAKNLLEPLELHYKHWGARQSAWFNRKDLEFLKKNEKPAP